MDIPWFTLNVLPWCVAGGTLLGFLLQARRQRTANAFAEASRRIQAQQLDVMKQQLEAARSGGPVASDRLQSLERRVGVLERRPKPASGSSPRPSGTKPAKTTDPAELELRRQELQIKAAELEEKRIRRQLRTAKSVWRWVEDNV